MVTVRQTVFSCAVNFLQGRKCIFCGSFKVNRTARGYIKCRRCGKSKSLSRLRREIAIVQGFYQQQPAYRLATDRAVDVKVVTRVYQRLQVVLGVRNIFDRDPPASNQGQTFQVGYDPRYGDPFGRTYYLRLSYAYK